MDTLYYESLLEKVKINSLSMSKESKRTELGKDKILNNKNY